MAKATIFIVIFLHLMLNQQIQCHKDKSEPEDYYWRRYTGSIPKDAVKGGLDENGTTVYIGEAYIHNHGLIVVQINPGNKDVFAPIHGVKITNRYTKILCGKAKNFEWLPATATNLHTVLIGKHAVIGGHEQSYGYLNVGRISFQGNIIIGKVNSMFIGEANFYFIHDYEEKYSDSYEVLVYKGDDDKKKKKKDKDDDDDDDDKKDDKDDDDDKSSTASTSTDCSDTDESSSTTESTSST